MKRVYENVADVWTPAIRNAGPWPSCPRREQVVWGDAPGQTAFSYFPPAFDGAAVRLRTSTKSLRTVSTSRR